MRKREREGEREYAPPERSSLLCPFIILYILYALMLLLQRMVLLKGNERQPNPENISLQPRDGCKLRKVVDHGKDKAAMIIRSA